MATLAFNELINDGIFLIFFLAETYARNDRKDARKHA